MSTLHDAILGGWELSSFSSRDAATGAVTHPLGSSSGPSFTSPSSRLAEPLGSAPRGLILYTGDGYMSAQLTTGTGAQLTTGTDETYIAYGGRFHVDEDTATVHHEVSVSMMPELLTAPQVRQVALDGDRLTLSATTTNDGVTSHNTLVWVRYR